MTGATPLWTPTDGNCCASGGRAVFRLGLKDRRLTLEDLKVTLRPGRRRTGMTRQIVPRRYLSFTNITATSHSAHPVKFLGVAGTTSRPNRYGDAGAKSS